MSRRERRQSEAYAEIQPACFSVTPEMEQAVVSAQAEKRRALRERPDPLAGDIGAETSIVEWMTSGFWTCGFCKRRWQPSDECPGVEIEQCPYCLAVKRVKWLPPAF